MSDLGEKVKKSIARYKAFEPPEGYYLADSGGKDSCVIKALAVMAGVKHDSHYRLTSVDPPELVRFVKEKHPDTEIDIPRDADGKQITMWNLIPGKLMPPTRRVRYCCDVLKETSGYGRLTVTGVRWQESENRATNQGGVTVYNPSKEMRENENFSINRQGGVVLNNDNDEARKMVEHCYTKHKTVLNPIIEWRDADIWEFISAEKIPVCELYGEGWKRLGCVGCPLASKRGREREFLRWPTYRAAYIRAFDEMLKARAECGKPTQWQDGLDVFRWWMEYDELPGQIDILEEHHDL